jgi:hypothetical protein
MFRISKVKNYISNIYLFSQLGDNFRACLPQGEAFGADRARVDQFSLQIAENRLGNGTGGRDKAELRSLIGNVSSLSKT